MAQLSKDKAFVKATFGDSMPDVIVYVKCHGSLIIDKEIQDSTGRVDSYDLFSLPDDFVDNILIFMLSGLGNCASDMDPMLRDFPTIKPGHKFTDIFNYLDDKYKKTLPKRVQHYQEMNSPLGPYTLLPLVQVEELIQGEKTIEVPKFVNAFINKYVVIGEDDDDIYIIDNEGNKIRLSDLDSVAKLLAKKRRISYYAALDLVEIAVTVDSGLVGGYDFLIPGGFNDERRLKDNRIQYITFKEVFFLLYLLGYRNPFILDSSCSGNYSLNGPQSERLEGRTAAKRDTPLISVSNLLRIDDKGNTNFTPYDKDSFDKNCDTIIQANKEYIAFIIQTVPGCTENLALIASNAIPSFSGATELVHAALYVINELKCKEEQAIDGIMATKNPVDGSFNVEAAIQYLRRKRGGKRIKKTMRRNAQRSKKTMRRNAQRSKKTIKRKT